MSRLRIDSDNKRDGVKMISWKEVDVPKNFDTGFEAGAKAYVAHVWDGLLMTMVGKSDQAGWHISVSHVGKNGKFRRLPNWDEIKEARYKFTPNEVTMVLYLPPMEQYVNAHPTCMNLFQVKGE